MNVTPIKTLIFKENEDIIPFIKKHVAKLPNSSVLIVTSKIVALSEGRTAALRDIEKVVRAESEWYRDSKYGKVTLKDGMYMWNAGIDASNADGKIILLPRDSYAAAERIRKDLKKHYKIKKLGVVITDSRIVPLRAGVVGIALGYAGFKGLRDYRGKLDISGRTLKFTQTDIADALATAAILVMGEGNERQPLCLIEDAPVTFAERVNREELLIHPNVDMYGPLFTQKKRSR